MLARAALTPGQRLLARASMHLPDQHILARRRQVSVYWPGSAYTGLISSNWPGQLKLISVRWPGQHVLARSAYTGMISIFILLIEFAIEFLIRSTVAIRSTFDRDYFLFMTTFTPCMYMHGSTLVYINLGPRSQSTGMHMPSAMGDRPPFSRLEF